MSKVLLSIIVPVYGVEKYIGKCLDALCSHLDKSTEVIIVDDGSPDSCPEICDSYAERYGGVRVIHKENGGLASAVICGIENSLGEYIGFCDGDDWVEDGFVCSVTEAIRVSSAEVIIFDYYRLTPGENGKNPQGSVGITPGYHDRRDCLEIRKRYMTPGGISPCRWNKVYKRELVDLTLKYYSKRARIGEDIIFTAPIIYSMESLYYIDTPLINYNVNEGSMTATYNSSYLDNFYLVYDSLSRFFDNDTAFLGHIHYINMRTLVNSVYKSGIKNKAGYLRAVISSPDFISRISSVEGVRLEAADRIFFYFMKKRRPRPLLFGAFLYKIGNKL